MSRVLASQSQSQRGPHTDGQAREEEKPHPSRAHTTSIGRVKYRATVTAGREQSAVVCVYTYVRDILYNEEMSILIILMVYTVYGRYTYTTHVHTTYV